MTGWMSGNPVAKKTPSIADQLIKANETLRRDNARLWDENLNLRAMVARLESRVELAESRISGKGREIE